MLISTRYGRSHEPFLSIFYPAIKRNGISRLNGWTIGIISAKTNILTYNTASCIFEMHRAKKFNHRRLMETRPPFGVLSGPIKLWYDKSS